MTQEQAEAICRSRMAIWAEYMASKHSTPVFALSVGHDQASGALVLCLPPTMSDDRVAELLRLAVSLIERKQMLQHDAAGLN
jgi:hypothetical protein